MFGKNIVAFAALALALPAAAGGNNVSDTSIPTREDWLDTCTDWDEWEKPGPPYKIFANTYYVGTCGISAILITGSDGHILIDSGTEAGADIVAANIQSLGIALTDIRVLLHSHEHFDHVGGLAKLQRMTGADVITSVGAFGTIATGHLSKDDPQHGMHQPMTPVIVTGTVDNGDNVEGGDILLEAIATPGHTLGALSWYWMDCDGAVCARIVYADSLSPVSSDNYRFSEHAEYLERYRLGLERLGKVECEILLTPHPSSSEMPERLASAQGLLGRTQCASYAEQINSRLNKRLRGEEAKRGEQ